MTITKFYSGKNYEVWICPEFYKHDRNMALSGGGYGGLLLCLRTDWAEDDESSNGLLTQ